MADVPPEEVLIEFLHGVALAAAADGPIVPVYGQDYVAVVRGSLLMRHWFGERARPPADLDLECFIPGLDRWADPYDQPWGFRSPLDAGRTLCRAAVDHQNLLRAKPAEIQFSASQFGAAILSAIGLRPEPSVESLWAYGTPGERYHIGWKWAGRSPRKGRMQIDLAQSRSYQLADIETRAESWTTQQRHRFIQIGYTPEMMLAAKLSWLMRSFKIDDPSRRNRVPPEWNGQLKDLFDAHLLITESKLDAAAFQKSLAAIGVEDTLDWQALGVLLDAGRAALPDHVFPDWKGFARQHESRLAGGPGEMLEEIAARLPALLGDFHRPEDATFLAAIAADPIDELGYALYADQLEDQGHAVAMFLRLFIRLYFHQRELPAEEVARGQGELREMLPHTAKPWLLRLFGTSARYRQMTERIAAGKMY